MLAGDDRSSICFPQIGEAVFSRIVMEPEYDIFGFNETIFIESLRKTVPPRRAVKLRTDWMAIPPTEFAAECAFNPPPPSACVLLMMFDARRPDADESLLFPTTTNTITGKDYLLNRFLRDIDEGGMIQLRDIGEATGKEVRQALDAVLTRVSK
jgi:hypothetical protein